MFNTEFHRVVNVVENIVVVVVGFVKYVVKGVVKDVVNGIVKGFVNVLVDDMTDVLKYGVVVKNVCLGTVEGCLKASSMDARLVAILDCWCCCCCDCCCWGTRFIWVNKSRLREIFDRPLKRDRQF